MTDVAQMPTEAESLDGLRKLIDIWGATDGGVDFPILDREEGKANGWTQVERGIATWVQAEHAVRSAEGILVLLEHNMLIQAVPLIRLIHECAVTAGWLVTTRGAGRSAMAEAQRLHALLIQGMAAMAGEDNAAEVKKLFEEADKFSTAQGKHFEQRCKALPEGTWLYPYFRLLSQYSHGGATLLNAYVAHGPVDLVRGHGYHLLDPELAGFRAGYLADAVVTLHMALAAWDAMDPEHRRTGALSAFGDARGFRTVFEVDAG